MHTMPERRAAGADLLVLGGGVIGLGCAWRAARAGLDVRVVDAGGTERATEVAAGMIAPVGEALWGEEALLAAAVESAARWPGFAGELESDAELPVPYRRCGSLHVGLDRDETAGLRRLHDLHSELGLEARWLRGSECRRLEPGLTTAVTGGYEAPGEAEIDTRVLLVALRAAAEARGVEVREGRAVELLVEDGRCTGARLESGEELHAERTLAALGARLGGELLPAEVRPPIRPVKGEVLRLRARPGEAPCERIIASERVYVVPRASGDVVIGATMEDRGFDLRVTAGGVHELLREAYRAVPEVAELELLECRAGLRPTTPDNTPVVGATAIEGLMLAGGHHRHGIMLAPVTADAVAAELSGGEVPACAAALRPGRFAARLEGTTA
ncbi:MAG: glycine oxidase ThiO [Solirubrobacterales bacterium]|nr:glycine oxidase ThiO [Solirubrobacterales bacterium]